MSILAHHLTYDHLQQLREARDEQLELIDGELLVTPSPSPRHQFLSQRLYDQIKPAIINAELGWVLLAPLDVFFADGTILQPDVIVILSEREDQIGEATSEGPPNLVMEILSLSTSTSDHGRKRDNYARYAVPEYWIIDPFAQSVTILSGPDEGRYRNERHARLTATSDTLPQISVDLELLFAPTPGR